MFVPRNNGVRVPADACPSPSPVLPQLKEAESEREQVTSRDATSESRELSIARDEMYAIVARRDAALSQLRERQRAMQVQAASVSAGGESVRVVRVTAG